MPRGSQTSFTLKLSDLVAVCAKQSIGKGDVDFNLNFSGPLLLEIDRGLGVTLLAGIHVGCFELFAKEGIRSVADLKGRTVGIQALESAHACFPQRDGDACWT